MINKNIYAVKTMCKLLSVSSSGYYDWLNRPISKRSQENIRLTAEINRIFDDEKSCAGSVRIAKKLKVEGNVFRKDV